MTAPSEQRLWELTAFTHLDSGRRATPLPLAETFGDSVGAPARSTLRLFEDGRLIGPPHATHADIIAEGGGRYSHWGAFLYCSSSDGRSPSEPGRIYHAVLLEGLRSGAWAEVAGAFERLPDAPDTAAAYAAVEEVLGRLHPLAVLGEDQKQFWTEHDLRADHARLNGGNQRAFERKFALINLLKLIADLPGDFAECGVYQGATAYFVAKAMRGSGQSRIFHLFDSFEGLPRPEADDGRFWKEGSMAAREEIARAHLAEFDGMEFRRGWIPDRFGEVSDRRFAFVHVDVDLYKPSWDSFAFFYPRTVRGGLIVCDDYGYLTCPGAKAAMDRFFADKPEPIVHLPTGQAFVIKR